MTSCLKSKLKRDSYPFLLVFLFISCNKGIDGPAYKDKTLSVEHSASDLIFRMTLEEKVGQLEMYSSKDLAVNGKLSIKKTGKILQQTTIGRIHDFYPGSAAILNELQHYIVQNSRLGMAALIIEEAFYGCRDNQRTAFPVPIRLASIWYNVGNVNLKGPFLCSQEARRRTEIHGGGVIINISSVDGTMPRKGLIHHCSAKAGLKMFSNFLSLELADKNVRVVSIAPGAIGTNMNKKEIANFGKHKFEEWIPQGRIGNVSDVANTVAFITSDLADYINGSDVYIDGAYMNHTIQYDPTRPERNPKKT